MGNLGHLSKAYLGKAEQAQGQCYLFLSVCAVFSCVQVMVWLPVWGIFNGHIDCMPLHSRAVGTP